MTETVNSSVKRSDGAPSKRVIRSCVIIFNTGSQYRRFRGLKRPIRDSIAVKSHARPYEWYRECREIVLMCVVYNIRQNVTR